MTFQVVMIALLAVAAVIAVVALQRGKTAQTSGKSNTTSRPVSLINALDLKEMLTSAPERPVAVLFFSNRCPACTRMEPLFQAAADQAEGALAGINYVRINVDENRSTVRRLGIKRIPMLMVFKSSDEQALDSHLGIMEPAQINKFIAEALVRQS